LSSTYRFEQNLKSLKKRIFKEDFTNVTDQVRTLFTDSLRHLPKDLVNETFLFFRQDLESLEGNWDEYFAKTALLLDAIELFNEEYDGNTSSLDQPFWQFLGESINDFAQEIDLELLEYLMKILVENKAL